MAQEKAVVGLAVAALKIFLETLFAGGIVAPGEEEFLAALHQGDELFAIGWGWPANGNALACGIVNHFDPRLCLKNPRGQSEASSHVERQNLSKRALLD